MINSEAYEKAFDEDNESLDLYTTSIAKFNRHFCELMSAGNDFTLKMEVHGNDGKLIHCRVTNDSFDRPGKNSK